MNKKAPLFRPTHHCSASVMTPAHRGGTPPPDLSFRVRSSDDVSAEDSHRLRHTLNNTLVNMGLLSAFMCALANGIYVNPPPNPICAGECRNDDDDNRVGRDGVFVPSDHPHRDSLHGYGRRA